MPEGCFAGALVVLEAGWGEAAAFSGLVLAGNEDKSGAFPVSDAFTALALALRCDSPIRRPSPRGPSVPEALGGAARGPRSGRWVGSCAWRAVALHTTGLSPRWSTAP